MDHHVGDVAVDEQRPGREVHNLVGGHLAVGAADPQVFRRLLGHRRSKKSGCASVTRAAAAVVGEEMGEGAHSMPGRNENVRLSRGFRELGRALVSRGDQAAWVSLRPRMPPTMRTAHKILPTEAGSLNSTMPRAKVPTAPIPVQTA